MSTNEHDNRKDQPQVISSLNDNGNLVEMIYDPTKKQTFLVTLGENGIPEYLDCYTDDAGATYYPYPATNNIVSKGIILFPSAAVDYGSKEDLVNAICQYIHRYLELDEKFERIAAYYVIFSWVYDAFLEVPYLRVVADFGRGKTRFIKTIGSICYKPIQSNGATTVSPMFRMIDEFKGTFVLDEADFSHSSMTSDFAKILNNGNAKGMPVLRSEANNNKTYSPKAFDVFSPKIMASRGFFKDKALESRFITHELGVMSRTDIPTFLTDKFEEEAEDLRNKLLMFRLKNIYLITPNNSLIDYEIEPRINQVILPLASIIDEPDLRDHLKEIVKESFEQTSLYRGMSTEGQILECLYDLYSSGNFEPGIKDIMERFQRKFGDNHDERKITHKLIGDILHRAFKLKTHRTRNGYEVPRTEIQKVMPYFERYGLEKPLVNRELLRQTVETFKSNNNLGL